MYASSKSHRSLVSRGVLSRAGSVSGPAHQRPSHRENVWVVICKRGAYCCGTLVYHPWSISWRIPRLRSGLGLRAFHGREKRQRSRGRVVASGASRLPARVACGGEDRLTHVVWQRQRPVADAGSYGASRGDADSNRHLKMLPVISCRPHARSDGQTRRANRVASGFRKLETLQQHPLAPTALTIDRCGGGKTQAHSDGERAAREISAAGEPVERAANHARPGGGARCARAARLQWQQPLAHQKAGAAECLPVHRARRSARRAEI